MLINGFKISKVKPFKFWLYKCGINTTSRIGVIFFFVSHRKHFYYENAQQNISHFTVKTRSTLQPKGGYRKTCILRTFSDKTWMEHSDKFVVNDHLFK